VDGAGPREEELGGSREQKHDVRIVVATNRNLAEEARAGRFRRDLFYRLSVARVRLPPLRERPEDVPVLASLFAAQAGVALSPEWLAVLGAYDWPGNVRELRNTVERAAAAGGPLELGGARHSGASLRASFVEGTRLRLLSEARARERRLRARLPRGGARARRRQPVARRRAVRRIAPDADAARRQARPARQGSRARGVSLGSHATAALDLPHPFVIP